MPVEDLGYLLSRAIDTIGDTRRGTLNDYRLSVIRSFAFLALMYSYLPLAMLDRKKVLSETEAILGLLLNLWGNEPTETISATCIVLQVRMQRLREMLNLTDEELERINERVRKAGLFV